MGNVVDIQGYPRLGQVPNKVLYLILAVLVPEKLDELLQPCPTLSQQVPPGFAKIFAVGVEEF